MELRRIKRQQAKRTWRAQKSYNKKERQSFNEYWKDYLEWLKGDKIKRLAKRGK